MITAKQAIALHNKIKMDSEENIRIGKYVISELDNIDISIREKIGKETVLHYSGEYPSYADENMLREIREKMRDLGFETYIMSMSIAKRKYNLLIKWK